MQRIDLRQANAYGMEERMQRRQDAKQELAYQEYLSLPVKTATRVRTGKDIQFRLMLDMEQVKARYKTSAWAITKGIKRGTFPKPDFHIEGKDYWADRTLFTLEGLNEDGRLC